MSNCTHPLEQLEKVLSRIRYCKHPSHIIALFEEVGEPPYIMWCPTCKTATDPIGREKDLRIGDKIDGPKNLR